ncbi:hypothetical protein [Intrasporangium sp. YIM S08009]|uniref:hypothetical protein n=1 Tax=Intrasporangium zincisolvens TaxID=3080018 RepID=UPI002B054950|nr:hypothetical protein [Intrasporangium sp. YIM S08009]
MTFRASSGEAVAALEEAARRAGMQHLSSDAATGLFVFTAGRMVLASGEKVTAQVREVAADTVQVTLSSNLQFGLGNIGRTGAARDRMAEAISQLLPAAS